MPLVIVNPRDSLSEYSRCDPEKSDKIGYRMLRCPRYGFEGDKDVIEKLNIRERALKTLELSDRRLRTTCSGWRKP
ncbi:MAG: hypothetical protein RQ885_07895 [Desulfurococcales archaeon]|jgi:hypothetical protein|nr:hypothetical protein [Desulfurococcales archaeon]